MSFVYGGVNTADLPGVIATLRTWPSLGGLSVETTAVPGAEGVVYGGASRSSVMFTFDVEITGDSPAEIFGRRDHFIGILDPSRGPRDLIVENEPDWIWPDVIVSSEVDWDRLVWLDGLGLVLTADVSFQTVGAASAREVEPAAYDGTGSVTFTADRGNTASYPSIMLPSGGDLLIQINDFELQLDGTPDGLTAALDFDAFRFDLLDPAGTRVESLVPYMQHYDRPKILPGEQVTAAATQVTDQTALAIVIYPNYRRI